MSSNFLNSEKELNTQVGMSDTYDAKACGIYVEEETAALKLVSPIPEKKTQSSFFLRRLHIINWIRTYNRDMAAADLVAGVTLGMTIIPQSIAYASLAGLSSQYGLYSAFVGSFVYVLFGTIPQVSIGPTSLMALLTLQFTMNFPVEFAIVLAFISGLIEMTMGILDLGFVVNFISRPVNSAFTTATSIIVVLVQLKGLLGIKNKYISTNHSNFFSQFSLGDSLLGSLCLATLLCLRQLNTITFKNSSALKKMLKRCFWYISISRNAIVIFFASLVAYKMVVLDGRSNIPFALSKKVNSSALSISLPPLTVIHNGTTYSFSDICNELRGGIFVVPFIAVLANIAIAKAFVQGTSLDASQEMLTLGLCNIVGSFFSSMPTCGAFTRSAVSQASGVRTPMAGVYTSSLVLLAIGVLTPYFEFIPKAALSAVLIIAVLFMLDFKILKDIWTVSKRDFFSWIVVFTLCIWSGVELGLIFGIILNMVFIAMRLADPNIEADIKELNGHYFIHVVPGADMYYTGAENLRNKINIMCTDCNYIYPVVIDCGRITQFDFTLTETLRNILRELKEKNVSTYLQSINCKDQGILTDLKIKTSICRDLEELKSFSLENK